MSSMLQVTALPTHHADLVTDIAYDYYGERLATASADQRIKVWRKVTNAKGRTGGGGWELEDEWKAHEAPILSLAFSHPEHGSLLVSSSYDRSVRVWEETDHVGGGMNLGGGGGASGGETNANGNANGNNGGPSQSQQPQQSQQQSQPPRPQRFLERAHLTDAKGSVRGVGWAPSGFGVKVASISTDSYLRIYSSLKPTLDDWQLTESIYLPTLSLPSASAATNAPSSGFPNEIPPAGASSYGSNTSGSFGNTNPSLMGGAHGQGSGSSAAQGQSQSQSQAQPQPQGPAYNPGKGNEALGGWGLSWCKEKWWGMVIATTSGHAGIVKVINLSAPIPTAILILEPPSSTSSRLAPSASSSTGGTGTTSTASLGPGSQAITSLSWAPNGGRSYHSIATGSRDGTVRIWKVYAPEPEEEDQRWRAEIAGEWGKGDATVGKVDWNITGSILSVSSEDGQVRLYKATFAGKWACMGSFSAEAPALQRTNESEDDGRMHE